MMTPCTECCWINILATLLILQIFGVKRHREVYFLLWYFSLLNVGFRDRGSCGTTGGFQDCPGRRTVCVGYRCLPGSDVVVLTPRNRGCGLFGNRLFAKASSAGGATLGAWSWPNTAGVHINGEWDMRPPCEDGGGEPAGASTRRPESPWRPRSWSGEAGIHNEFWGEYGLRHLCLELLSSRRMGATANEQAGNRMVPSRTR